jgi:lipopolysaccharide export system protein LptC
VNTRQAALFAILLLVVIGTGWFLDKQSVNRLPASVSETGPDSFVKDINLAVMDVQGQLKYRLKAEHMTHFPNEELLRLTRPDIDVIHTDGAVWRIIAKRGETATAGDRIWLLGAVDIRRTGTATDAAIHVVTRDLLVKPEEDMAETENATTITGSRYVINALGMKANFRTGTLELLSRVKGTLDGDGKGDGAS